MKQPPCRAPPQATLWDWDSFLVSTCKYCKHGCLPSPNAAMCGNSLTKTQKKELPRAKCVRYNYYCSLISWIDIALWILLVSIEYRVSKINHGIEYRMKIRYRTSTTVCSFNPITHLIQFKCTTYKYNITNIRGAPDLVSGRIIRPDSKNHYPVHLHVQHKLYIK